MHNSFTELQVWANKHIMKGTIGCILVGIHKNNEPFSCRPPCL
jgi:hypothetical protein